MKRGGTINLSTVPIHRATETRVAPARGQFPSQSWQSRGRGEGPLLCCSQNSGPYASLFLFTPLPLSYARPPDICHLFSVKFSCKVSQRVVPDNQHVMLSGCRQIAFSSFILTLGFPGRFWQPGREQV